MIGRTAQSKIVLHLSKPWDLGESLGWSSLPALIDDSDGERWLVELEKPFHFGDSEYRFFVVAPRLEGSPLSDAASCEVPCSLTPTTADKLSRDRPWEVLPRESDAAIVGSITEYH